MPRDKRSKEWMTPLRERRLPIHRATHSLEREGHKCVLAIARSGRGLGDGPGRQRHRRYAHERGEDADLTRQPERGGRDHENFATNRSL